MLQHIAVKNLRSIRDLELRTAPITVLYGPNASGKSSLIHALSVFQNVLQNPAESIYSFLNVGFIDFGGFEQVVSGHDRHRTIQIQVACASDSAHVAHSLYLRANDYVLRLTAQDLRPLPDLKSLDPLDLSWPSTTPDGPTVLHLDAIGATWDLYWNGVAVQLRSSAGRGASEVGGDLVHTLNLPSGTVQNAQFVPLKRGFSKANYGPGTPRGQYYGEDRLAHRLFTQPGLDEKVDLYLQAITGCSFRATSLPIPERFILEAVDPTSQLATLLVNEGAGINQATYLLGAALLDEASLVTIEEPEIHLHPDAVRRLALALVDIANAENRTFIVSTHSESFVVALLGAVAQHKLQPDSLACYLVRKKEGQSSFDRQNVTATGQLEGGLRSFMEAQLEDLKYVLGVTDDRK